MKRTRISGSPRNPSGTRALIARSTAPVGQLDMRVRTLGAERIETTQQQPHREDRLDRNAQLRFPSRRQRARRVLQPARFVDERTSAQIERSAGLGENGLATAQVEQLDAQQPLDRLHRVRYARLTLVQRFGRPRIAAILDDRGEHLPLVQGNARCLSHVIERIDG
jgi:hypothetical protein